MNKEFKKSLLIFCGGIIATILFVVFINYVYNAATPGSQARVVKATAQHEEDRKPQAAIKRSLVERHEAMYQQYCTGFLLKPVYEDKEVSPRHYEMIAEILTEMPQYKSFVAKMVTGDTVTFREFCEIEMKIRQDESRGMTTDAGIKAKQKMFDMLKGPGEK